MIRWKLLIAITSVTFSLVFLIPASRSFAQEDFLTALSGPNSESADFTMTELSTAEARGVRVVGFDREGDGKIRVQDFLFGEDGVQTKPPSIVTLDPTLLEEIFYITKVRSLRSGEGYLVVGKAQIGWMSKSNPTNVAVARVDREGSLDTSFANNGIYKSVNRHAVARDIVEDEAGGVSVIGRHLDLTQLSFADFRAAFFMSLSNHGTLESWVFKQVPGATVDVVTGISWPQPFSDEEFAGFTFLGTTPTGEGTVVTRLEGIVDNHTRITQDELEDKRPRPLSDLEQETWKNEYIFQKSLGVVPDSAFGTNGNVDLKLDFGHGTALCQTADNYILVAGPKKMVDTNYIAFTLIDDSGEVGQELFFPTSAIIDDETAGQAEVLDMVSFSQTALDAVDKELAILVRIDGTPYLLYRDQ